MLLGIHGENTHILLNSNIYFWTYLNALCFWSPIYHSALSSAVFSLSDPYFGCYSCWDNRLICVQIPHVMSIECFLGIFLIGGTCKEGIIILLFSPALTLFHCLVFILQKMFNFWEIHISFFELIFYHKYSSFVLRL